MEGVSCDWAYWYLPDTGAVRPARVTLRSTSRRAEGEAGEENKGNKENRESKPWRKFMKKPSTEESKDVVEEKDIPKVPDKPWRTHMKKAVKAKPVEEEVSVKKPEKPWRANMKPGSAGVEEVLQPDPRPEEPEVRPWRENMKKKIEPPKPVSPKVKKRHYDRGEVKEYMKAKRAKEREEKEEREREEKVRKEVVRRRLAELEQLQRQITESSTSPEELRRLGLEGGGGEGLDPGAQEILRQKLLELTEQMKEQWRERRGARGQVDQVEQVYRKDSIPTDGNNLHLVSEHLDSSRKVSNKESLKVTARAEEKLSMCESLPPARVADLSDLSDATEIRSISDKVERSGGEARWGERLGEGRQMEELLPNNLSTPLTDEVPERDVSDSAGEGRREGRARVEEDLLRVREEVERRGVLPSPPALDSQDFVPNFPSVITTGPYEPPSTGGSYRPSSGPNSMSLPTTKTSQRVELASVAQRLEGAPVSRRVEATPVPQRLAGAPVPHRLAGAPVPVPRPEVVDSCPESDGAPVWIDVTRNEEEDDLAGLRDQQDTDPGNLSATRYRAPPGGLPDPHNFMTSLARKYRAGEVELSEGPLSSLDSSAASSQYCGPPRTASRGDSEATLGGLPGSLGQDSSGGSRAKARSKSSRSQSSRSQESGRSRTSGFEAPNLTQVSHPPPAGATPSALHLRFLTELHQLESVTSAHQMVAELEQVKRSALEQHHELEQVQGEVTRQRRRLEEQEGEGRVAAVQQELQEMYSGKLAALLEGQHEAARVTGEVARHLAALQAPHQESPVIRQLQTIVEQLQARGGGGEAAEHSTTPTTTTRERGREATTEQSTEVTSRSMEVTVEPSETRRLSSSSIQVDPQTFTSKTPSSILEMLDRNELVGSSIQRTISEALASISEGDQRTRSNITAEVEEELSTDYSSQFEDESTLREQGLRALLPSEAQRRQVSRRGFAREVSTEDESSIHFSEVEEEARPTSSLFSDNDSFTKFSLEMVNQYMQEEKVRAQHKAALLKVKEKTLIAEARRKVADLEQAGREMVDKGKDDKMPSIKKKQRSILLKLKERRAEIAGMRENLRVAERERSFMLEEQRSLVRQEGRKAKGAATNLSTGESADQESDAPEDKIAQIEVLKGLKKLDKNRKTMTTKERRFVEKKDRSGMFDTSRGEESGSEATDTVVTAAVSRHTSAASEVATEQASAATVPTVVSSRPRHSSESEAEASLATSLQDTVTDHSDIEARIAALNTKLSSRMKVAARLKKEQRRERKEALRSQEEALRRQIEKFDMLITEGRAEVDKEQVGLVVMVVSEGLVMGGDR